MNQICPVCGAEYLGWVTRCVECGIALVPPGDAPDPTQLPEEQQVIYELGSWSLDAQAAVAEAMAGSGIPHGWIGTDLVVHIDHEETVDDIVDEIEASTDQPPAPYDAEGVSDEASGEIVYDLDEWPTDERDELTRRLTLGGVPHRWESQDTLVIASRDEALVEALLDQVEQHEPGFGGGDDGDDDEEADEANAELLSELFLAADRLREQPLDPAGLAGLVSVLEEADPDRPPYGVAGKLWTRALERADRIAEVLTGTEADDEADDGADEGDADLLDQFENDEAAPPPPAGRASADLPLNIEGNLDADRHGAVTTMAAELRAILRPFV